MDVGQAEVRQFQPVRVRQTSKFTRAHRMNTQYFRARSETASDVRRASRYPIETTITVCLTATANLITTTNTAARQLPPEVRLNCRDLLNLDEEFENGISCSCTDQYHDHEGKQRR